MNFREELRLKIREIARGLAPEALDPFTEFTSWSKDECKFLYEHHGLVEDLTFRENIASVRQSIR